MLDIQLDRVKAMVSAKDMSIDVDNEAKDWLVQLGYDAVYGARPLKRTIQKYLINPLSKELLLGNFTPGECHCCKPE